MFFVDYGNVETISLTELYSLHTKFQEIPFHMIQRCFSSNSELVYEREVSLMKREEGWVEWVYVFSQGVEQGEMVSICRDVSKMFLARGDRT